MLENTISELIVSVLTAGLTAQGYSDVAVLQSDQPTLQGADSAPALYFFKMYDHPYGFTKRDYTDDGVPGVLTLTETQTYETAFQMKAAVTRAPSDISGYTAGDLIKSALGILNSTPAIETFQAVKVGILRILMITNPTEQNDSDQFQSTPVFEFTLVHDSSTVNPVPVVTDIVPGIYRI